MVITGLKFIMIFYQGPKVGYCANFNEIHSIHDLTDRETTILRMTAKDTDTILKMQRGKNDLVRKKRLRIKIIS